MRFRKKPVEFDAVQFDGTNFEELQAFVGARTVDGDVIPLFNPIGTYLVILPSDQPVGELWVAANQAWLPIDVGEWVVKDALGFYPCKDEIMKKNNEPVT